MSEVISSFKSMRAGSQVFTLILFLCVILWSSKRLQLLCILSIGMFDCQQNHVCKDVIVSVYTLQCVSWWVLWTGRKQIMCLR